jgi:hypothetical protein
MVIDDYPLMGVLTLGGFVRKLEKIKEDDNWLLTWTMGTVDGRPLLALDDEKGKRSYLGPTYEELPVPVQMLLRYLDLERSKLVPK